MHLLYSRFFTKAMPDLGLIDRARAVQAAVQPGPDPGRRRRADEQVAGQRPGPRRAGPRYGADTVRLFLMFMGPWDQGGPWSPTGIGGVHRFLNRVWTLALDPNGREPGDPDAGDAAGRRDRGRRPRATLRGAAHRTLRDVTADYEAFRFNTMIAKLMELANTLFRYRGTPVAGGPEWDEAIRPAAADAGAGRAAHHRGAVEPAAGGGRRARGRRSTRSRGPRSTSPPWPRRPARSRSRSTASCATKLTVPVDIDEAALEAAGAGQPEDRGGPRRPRRRDASSTPAAGSWSTSSSATEVDPDALRGSRGSRLRMRARRLRVWRSGDVGWWNSIHAPPVASQVRPRRELAGHRRHGERRRRGIGPFRRPVPTHHGPPRLAAWFDAIADGNVDTDEIDFIEPNLAFRKVSDQRTGKSRSESRSNWRPASMDDVEDDWGSVWLEFPVTRRPLTAAADDVRDDLERFPERWRGLV